MDDTGWFEGFDGPTTLCADGEGNWLCAVGWNVQGPEGGVTGREVRVIAATPAEAVQKCRAEYEREQGDALTEIWNG